MGKSRAEIQRAYRKKQKLKGPAFLSKLCQQGKDKSRNGAAEADAYRHAACLTQGRAMVGNGSMHSLD
ncbi:hypothetical protein DPMN_085634 [Dreissena polymorpha]|uniref:Uncharacterized protein n=1 Tax=Dreissena polymorpha TaxID=45954 RepID=A0A9D3YGH2_DREPO|nr:hypothetical protein DPMN_085634 [Dreissena polymorpha]